MRSRNSEEEQTTQWLIEIKGQQSQAMVDRNYTENYRSGQHEPKKNNRL